jgi:hypothetical protein
MAFTQTQLDAIESAIGSGELKVMFDGREVIYRSIDDLIKARNTIRESLQASGAIAATTRTSYASRVRN